MILINVGEAKAALLEEGSTESQKLGTVDPILKGHSLIFIETMHAQLAFIHKDIRPNHLWYPGYFSFSSFRLPSQPTIDIQVSKFVSPQATAWQLGPSNVICGALSFDACDSDSSSTCFCSTKLVLLFIFAFGGKKGN